MEKVINERQGASYIYEADCSCEGRDVVKTPTGISCAECLTRYKRTTKVDTGERVHRINSPQ